MHIARSAAELRERMRHWREPDSSIAFVPTMGNLHAGHLQLVRHAKAVAGRVVVSIFVNPMQFGPQEDFARYPQTLAADQAALMDIDVDLLFLPAVAEIYPHGAEQSTVVEVPGLNAILEGEHRPTHFNGVSTVVAKLFNLVLPDIAVFGEKDYQQLLVIRRMVRDLGYAVRIVAAPTVREGSGLAMSSRNAYLDPRQRSAAAALYTVLTDAAQRLKSETADLVAVERQAAQKLEREGLRLDYVAIRRSKDLDTPDPTDRKLRVLAAAWCGNTRLIDNVAADRVGFLPR